MFNQQFNLWIQVFFLGILLSGCATTKSKYGLTQIPTDYSITKHNIHNDDNMVYAYSGGYEKLFKYNVIEKGDTVLPLIKADKQIIFKYRGFYDSNTYLSSKKVTGLLVIKDNKIVLEHYGYGRNELNRLLSNSMSKSIISLLIGIAIDEGKINNIDDLVKKYVPKLSNHPYGNTSIRNLLKMSSGIKFSKTNEPISNSNKFVGVSDNYIFERGTWLGEGAGGVSALMPFKDNKRIFETGKGFQYSNVETFTLGLVLKQATGKSVSKYLSQKIWKPMGAESSATWFVDNSGQEMGSGFFSAILRDYGRLGLLLANGGIVNYKQIIPKEWLAEATKSKLVYPYKKYNHKDNTMGYGYQFWILRKHPKWEFGFAMLGANGQCIFVSPKLNLVMVQTAVFNRGDGASTRETHILWRAIVKKYGKEKLN